MTQLLAPTPNHSRLDGVRVACGPKAMASIRKRAGMCKRMCKRMCIGCLEGCCPDTTLRPGRTERS